ncbi:hypothetical protein CF326_g5155 [Tilletia indica]|nr:hypothetical protein CF326_g5155 [Tilletia indica]
MASSMRVLARVVKEIQALSKSPLPGIRLGPATTSASDPASDPLDDPLHLCAWIQGPPDTPYTGGYFAVHINIESAPAFPAEPPKCTFATQIFHPNVSRAGEICVSTLKKDWKPEYGIGHILLTIKCLLIAPNPESALDPESARLLLEEYDEYSRIARLWTSVHASPAKCPAHLFADDQQPDPTPSASTTALESSHQMLNTSSTKEYASSSSRGRLASASSSKLPITGSTLSDARAPSPSSLMGPLESVGNVPTTSASSSSKKEAVAIDASGGVNVVPMDEDEDEQEDVVHPTTNGALSPPWSHLSPSAQSRMTSVVDATSCSSTRLLEASPTSHPHSMAPSSSAQGPGPLGFAFYSGSKIMIPTSATPPPPTCLRKPPTALKRGLKRL